MAEPTLDAFIASTRNALVEICVEKKQLALFDAKGSSFHFYDDGGLDSLDMLDVVFFIDKDLGIKIGLEKLVHSGDSMTVKNLYGVIQQEAKPPA